MKKQNCFVLIAEYTCSVQTVYNLILNNSFINQSNCKPSQKSKNILNPRVKGLTANIILCDLSFIKTSRNNSQHEYYLMC